MQFNIIKLTTVTLSPSIFKQLRAVSKPEGNLIGWVKSPQDYQYHYLYESGDEILKLSKPNFDNFILIHREELVKALTDSGMATYRAVDKIRGEMTEGASQIFLK